MGSVFIENIPSSEGACTCAHANHAENDAQKGCAMQLNGIALSRHSVVDPPTTFMTSHM